MRLGAQALRPRSHHEGSPDGLPSPMEQSMQHTVYYEAAVDGPTAEDIEAKVTAAVDLPHTDGPTAYGSGLALAAGMVEVDAADIQSARELVADRLASIGAATHQLAVMPPLDEALAV